MCLNLYKLFTKNGKNNFCDNLGLIFVNHDPLSFEYVQRCFSDSANELPSDRPNSIVQRWSLSSCFFKHQLRLSFLPSFSLQLDL